MTGQIPVASSAAVEGSSEHPYVEVTADLALKRLAIVNVVLVGRHGAGDRQWVLVDTGVAGTGAALRHAARERFGAARPAAILTTHGHADHAGNLKDLADAWDAPVYAHPLEMPYLDGGAAYPPPDPLVGGGLMSLSSPLFPRGPFDVRDRLRPLPEGGSVPFMPGWRWIHTPGHTVGHVSFWREADGVLLSGDAFISTNQESAYAVAVQAPELHGPPMYYTVDFAAARRSVETLAALQPKIAITGHGPALKGPAMLASLHDLAARFDTVAVPKDGRYVKHAAHAADRSAYPPPAHKEEHHESQT